MTEHIDSNRINNDLRYRFEYLSKFINFTSNDISLLNKFAVIIFTRIPVIADTVYRKLFSFDITTHYFLARHHDTDKFYVNCESNLTFLSAQMAFRKDMLSMYLKRVLTQHDWNDAFLQYLSHVGQMHTSKAGSSQIHVDYIHIIALFGYLERLLIDYVLHEEHLNNGNKRLMILAINKLFWIQNDFFSMHFITQSKNNTSTKDEKQCEDSIHSRCFSF